MFNDKFNVLFNDKYLMISRARFEDHCFKMSLLHVTCDYYYDNSMHTYMQVISQTLILTLTI